MCDGNISSGSSSLIMRGLCAEWRRLGEACSTVPLGEGEEASGNQWGGAGRLTNTVGKLARTPCAHPKERSMCASI